MKISSPLLAVAVGVIAGCSDNAAGIGAGSPVTTYADALDQLQTNFNTAWDDNAGPTTSTDLANLASATTTTASYSGIVALDQRLVSNPDTYRGIISLDMDFANTAVTGTIDRFNVARSGSSDEVALTDGSSFDITGTYSNTNDPGITGQATGTLEGQPDAMNLTGTFAGTDAQSVGLTLDGTAFTGSGYADKN